MCPTLGGQGKRSGPSIPILATNFKKLKHAQPAMLILTGNFLRRVNSEGTRNVQNQILCTIPVTAPFYNLNSKSNLGFLMLAANNAKKHFLKGN